MSRSFHCPLAPLVMCLWIAFFAFWTPPASGGEAQGKWKLTWFDTIKNKEDHYFADTKEAALNYKKNHLLGEKNAATGRPAFVRIQLNYVGEESDKIREIETALVEVIKEGSQAIDTAREAKAAADKAKEISEEGALKAYSPKDRKLADTLKDYTDSIKGAYRRVTEAKSTLTSGVSGAMDKRFAEVNKLIDSFNKSAEAYNTEARAAGIVSVPTIARVTPEELTKNTAPKGSTIKKPDVPVVDVKPNKPTTDSTPAAVKNAPPKGSNIKKSDEPVVDVEPDEAATDSAAAAVDDFRQKLIGTKWKWHGMGAGGYSNIRLDSSGKGVGAGGNWAGWLDSTTWQTQNRRLIIEWEYGSGDRGRLEGTYDGGDRIQFESYYNGAKATAMTWTRIPD